MSDTNNNAAEHDNPTVTESGQSLAWNCHPANRRPWVTAGVTGFILVCAMLVYIVMDSKAFATLALVILFASLAKFYFPTRYRLDDAGITVRTSTQTLHKEWSIYRSMYPDRNGVLLSPFAEPSRLENFRGLYLMFANNGDEVVEFIKPRLGTKPATPAAKPAEESEA